MSRFQAVAVSARLSWVLAAMAAIFTDVMAAPVDRGSDPQETLSPGAIARLGSLRLRHESEVRAIAFSPDGKKIASLAEYTVRVWDPTTGKLLHEFRAPGICSCDVFNKEEDTIAFTPDGQAIAAGVKADVCFWDLQSGKEVRRFRGTGHGVQALTFARDGKSFYCGGADNKLYHWDIASGKLLRSWDYFEGKPPRIYAAGHAEKTAVLKAISPDGKTAVWLLKHWAEEGRGAMEGERRVLWDAATGKDRCPLDERDIRDSFDARIVLSADGKYLTAATEFSEPHVWDAATGKQLKAPDAPGPIVAAAYSLDGRLLAGVTSHHKTNDGLHVWEVATGKAVWYSELNPWYWQVTDLPRTMAFSPSGKSIALAHQKNVLLWDTALAKQIPVLEGHRWPVLKVEFSPKDGVLLSNDDACLCEWSEAHRQVGQHRLTGEHKGFPVAESVTAKVRICHPRSGPLQLRDLITDELLCDLDEIKVADGWYYGCFSSDGRTVALFPRSAKPEIVFLDVPSRKVRWRLPTKDSAMKAPVLSSDGKLLAAVCSDQTVVLIDSSRRGIVRRLGTPQPPPDLLGAPGVELTEGTFSADGEFLAFGTHVCNPGAVLGIGGDPPPNSPGIRVWRVATGRELRQFENCLSNAPHGHIGSLRFTPDSKSLAVAMHFNPWDPGDPEEAAVPVLEVATGRLRRRFKGHTDHVYSVAFSRDGKVLASGSRDTTILLWDMTRPAATDPSATKPAPARVRLHWRHLAWRDAAAAYDAVLALTAMPEESVPFLTSRLQPVEAPSKAQLAQWIADLDAAAFQFREEADARLTAAHEMARPALKQALSGKVSVEARRRIREMLAQLDAMTYPPDLLRELRALEVLERIATPEARRVLERVASGAAEAILTIEARASLARLNAAR
jgi:WD40 repeat protein